MMAQQGDISTTSTLGDHQFNTPQEEIAFLRQKLQETQQEFIEFQESSRELEAEYETNIKQLEKKNSELSQKLVRLEDENDQLKTRYTAYTSDTQHKLNEYQNQIGELTSVNDRLTSYIRELEQSNDDLERARRALAASLEDFESQLNQQIERNVLLENEVSEKEELECIVQRLKEETRDLHRELVIKSNNSESIRRRQMIDSYMTNSPNLQTNTSLHFASPQSELNDSIASKFTESLTNGSSTAEISSQDINENRIELDSPITNGSDDKKGPMVDSTTSPITSRIFSFASSNPCASVSPKSVDSKSQQTSSPSSPTLPSIAMSPSSRISALNIVSDLLRKVGALESKLASAKKMTTSRHG